MPRDRPALTRIAGAVLLLGHPALHAQDAEPADRTRTLGTVTVTGSQSTSLPTTIPTTLEGIGREQIERSINATDSEDALKYLPSLLVRKRYIGDYNHAVLSTRASGTGNSARSLVYADGILLSNLLGNGATFAPRWGLVTPEEIERVDVLYGPFSAAYPGNSVGAVVDYVTRMPRRFEAHAKVGYSVQPNEQYGHRHTYTGWQASTSLGNRQDGFAWWINLNRTLSNSQPLVIVTKPLSGTTAGTPAVTGAVADRNPRNADVVDLGTSTQYHTVQDHAKVKLAYDVDPTLRASYTLGWWRNQSRGASESFLRDAGGNPVYSGAVNLDGRAYTLGATDFPQSREQLEHWMHAVSLRRRSRGVFDWELSASRYDYRQDRLRAPTVARPAADTSGAGRITDMAGTGWQTLAAKGTWRPDGAGSRHGIDFGLQQDQHQLRNRVGTAADNDWLGGAPGAFAARYQGDTRLQSAYAQDAWRFAEHWQTVLGLRAERWTAWNGLAESSFAGSSAPADSPCSVATGRCLATYEQRTAQRLSPKAALSFQAAPDWVLKASTGRAFRFPTVSELYQAGFNASGQAITNNPSLRPERSWTTELSAEWQRPWGQWRATLFHENTHDAIYAFLDASVSPNTNRVRNVGRIRTRGLETALQAQDVFVPGLDFGGSVTYAQSQIMANDWYVNVPGDTLGKDQPRVPRWRATAVATWRMTERLAATLGARYSGRQFNTLDNGDPNGFTYTGTSKYFTTDLRLHYRLDRQWSAALGIDNANNARYWNFHPYPQRTYSAEVRFDL